MTRLSLRYYLGLVALVSFLLGLVAAAMLGPRIFAFLESAEPVVRDLYPEELVITIKSGAAASNVPEPYRIAVPERIQQVLGTTTAHLVVVNTKEKADSGIFRSLDTWVLVARDGVLFMRGSDAGAAIEFRPYTEDFVITRERYLSYVDTVKDAKTDLPAVILAIFVTLFFAWGVLRLVYFLFASCLVYLLLRAYRLPATFGYAYRLSIHAATLPILLNLLILFLTGDLRTLAALPFAFTLALLAVVWINMRNIATAPDIL